LSLEQLYPERRELEASDAYAGLGLAEHARPDRPYVVANMVLTADGRAALGGHTESISSDTDRELFLELRLQVDAVMVGTGTIAIEEYGPLVRAPERRERRREAGLEPVPLAITASRSMELPVATPLFQDEETRIVVVTSSDREPPPAPAAVSVIRTGGDEPDFVVALRRLRAEHGVRSVLLEGGPTLLSAMAGAGVVDELFLTLSPLLTGSGGEPAILEGSPLPAPIALTLRSALREDGYLYLRYALRVPG
jgi:riboflavin biosynthesis pyrimidine reductase